MRILIDTDIFFRRENHHVITIAFEELTPILEILDSEILIHPIVAEKMERNLNESKKKIEISIINTYPLLELAPNPENDQFFLNLIGSPSNPKDDIDNALLYSVYKDAVDYLITEDRRIKHLSDRLGIEERILYIDEAVKIFGGNIFDKNVSGPPALKDEFVSNLDINDSFFDSLKEDYKEFNEWINKVSRAGRKCWVYFNESGSIGALLIYKFENESIDSIPPLSAKRRLKISTFKVTHTGYKIGELFIKKLSEFAIKNDLDEIYLTYFTKPDDYLVALIVEYGFYPVVRNRRGEDIYVKKLILDDGLVNKLIPSEIAKKFYPIFYDGVRVKKYLVPIDPECHQRLFTEYKNRQTILLEHLGEFIIEGNTIKKAHLINRKNTKILPGDILLFYRKTDIKALISLGIVEKVFQDIRSQEDIMKNVGNRAFYGSMEMMEKPATIILFTWHLHLAKPLKYSDLKEMHISPQYTLIPHEKYLIIKSRGEIDERFTVH